MENQENNNVKKIKLVVTDMDGTLLDDQKNMPPDFPEWVLNHPGIKTVIASGRQYYTLYEEFEKVEIADKLIYIAENGGLVVNGKNILYQNTLKKSEVREVFKRIETQDGVTAVLCGVKSAYLSENASAFVEEQTRLYYRRLKFISNLTDCPEIESENIIKIALYIDDYQAANMIKNLRDLGGRLKSVVSGPDWIDIGAQEVNKGSALAAIQDFYKISQAESMGFGDYMNDYEFLERCGESYAMANACPEILNLTKYRTAANTEDGVMKILRGL